MTESDMVENVTVTKNGRLNIVWLVDSSGFGANKSTEIEAEADT